MSDEEDYSEEDELDDLNDPRVMEIDSDDEAPKLVEAKKDKKGKNKRAADDDEENDVLQALLKPEEANGEKKLSKKQLKKLKNNAGEAAEAPKVEEKATSKKDAKKDAKKEKKAETTPNKEVNGSAKKVQFAKELEQGPTPTKADAKKGKGSRVVGGVTIDERKSGSGPAAKKGDKISMRYIGKLKDGKVFDCKFLFGSSILHHLIMSNSKHQRRTFQVQAWRW
jgi:FK506-binding nuclear protein